jgi:DNA-binding LacI/PurR family transcriptional regulator
VIDHVLALGHRRVALLAHRVRPRPEAGPLELGDIADATVRVSRERLEEGVRALATVGATPTAIWVAGGNDQLAGQVAASRLLAAHPDVTAIVCTTDQIALGAVRAASAAGRRVPLDLSITGFDDVPEAAVSDPPLTTVRQPLVDKGRAAAALLLEQIETGDRRRIELPIELVVRGSTAPA